MSNHLRYIQGNIKTNNPILPELWDSEGRVLFRLGALLSRDMFLGLGGTVGGLGWWGGVKHFMGLWGPGGLTGLVGLSGDSLEERSALVEVSVLPFRCRSTAGKINISVSFTMNKSVHLKTNFRLNLII